MIISFHADAIAECKKQLPQFKAYWLTDFKKQDGRHAEAHRRRGDRDAQAHRCRRGQTPKRCPSISTKRLSIELRDAGYEEFHVWTVDDPEVARFYRDLGATSITTNRPGWLREQLGASRKRRELRGCA